MLTLKDDEVVAVVETAVGQAIEKREDAKAFNVAASRENNLRLFNRVLILIAILGTLFLVFREQSARFQIEGARIQIEAKGGGDARPNVRE